MKREIFAICDPEADYVLRLMEFLQAKRGVSFDIQAFTSVHSLKEYAGKHQISLLLISDRAMSPEIRELPIEKIMILSEGQLLKEMEGYPSIYKYQAADSLIAEVMSAYAVQRKTGPQPLLKRYMRCIAVYSPIRRVQKTSFALTLGQLLARDRGALYLNMESYSGFHWLMEKEFQTNLADLMYFVKRGYGSVVYKLQSMTESVGNLDYIPPAISPSDIRSVACSEWLALLEEIETYSAYEAVILDFDEMTDGFLELLRRCDRIYMPVREDGLSVAKLRQYEKFLELSGYGDLEEKTRRLKLPFHSSFGSGKRYAEQLIWGELGDYTRNLIREDMNGRGK